MEAIIFWTITAGVGVVILYKGGRYLITGKTNWWG